MNLYYLCNSYFAVILTVADFSEDAFSCLLSGECDEHDVVPTVAIAFVVNGLV